MRQRCERKPWQPRNKAAAIVTVCVLGFLNSRKITNNVSIIIQVPLAVLSLFINIQGRESQSLMLLCWNTFSRSPSCLLHFCTDHIFLSQPLSLFSAVSLSRCLLLGDCLFVDTLIESVRTPGREAWDDVSAPLRPCTCVAALSVPSSPAGCVCVLVLEAKNTPISGDAKDFTSY